MGDVVAVVVVDLLVNETGITLGANVDGEARTEFEELKFWGFIVCARARFGWSR